MKKKIAIVLLIITVTLMQYGCSKSSENENYILMVKTAINESYDGEITYGDAFDEFFSNPQWTYFNGVWESFDDDGDGEPDEIVDDVDVVEFTGSCQYRGVSVDALVQFVLDLDEGKFSAKYLSFNDIPQDMFTMSSLFNTVFSDYINNHPEIFEPKVEDLYDDNAVKDPESVDYICGTYYDIENYDIKVEITKIDDLHAQVKLSSGDGEGNYETDYDFTGTLEQGPDRIYTVGAAEAIVFLTKDGLLHVDTCEMNLYNTLYEKAK